MKKPTKKLTLKDFPIVYRWDDECGDTRSGIRWEDCENIMGKAMYKKFCKYMFGSAFGQDGVYPWDVNDFLNGRPNLD